MAITLFPHQKADLEALRASKAYALWHEVGVGKTYPLIFRAVEGVISTKKMWVVIAEIHLLYQWRDEIKRVADGMEISTRILSGETEAWERHVITNNPPDIILTNYEFFPRFINFFTDMANKGRIGGIICDEAHRLKGFKGFRKKTGAIPKAIYSVAHIGLGTDNEIARYMASGSPVTNPNKTDIWGLYYFLDKTIFGDVHWQHEQDFFYDLAPRGARYVDLQIKPHMKQEMSRRMYLIARRMLKSETGIRFPEVRPIVYRVPLPTKVRSVYDDLERDCFAFAEGQTVTRLLLLGRLMALQQISSGFVLEDRDAYFDPLIMERDDLGGKKVLHLDSSHKDNVLWSIIDEIGRKESVIIWAHFRHELDHIASMLEAEGIKTARVWGDQSAGDKRTAIEEFKAGKRTHMVAQPSSAGAGLNLQIAGHSIRYSRSHKLLDLIQSEGRNMRVGSIEFHEQITYHEIVALHTRDEFVYESLREKHDVSQELTLDALVKARLP